MHGTLSGGQRCVDAHVSWFCYLVLYRSPFLQVKALNDGGEFPSNAEVVIAPPSIHAQSVKESIRSDIKVKCDVGEDNLASYPQDAGLTVHALYQGTRLGFSCLLRTL